MLVPFLQPVLSFLSTSLTFSFYGLNWLDILVLLVILFYAVEGIMVGFVIATLDLLSFVFSFVIGIKLYSIVGDAVATLFSIPHGFANALGFFLAASIGELVSAIILRKIVYHAIAKHKQATRGKGPSLFGAYVDTINHIVGVVPGTISALILLAFFLTLLVTLPVSPFIKKSVTSSKLGSKLVANTQGFEQNLDQVFGGAVNDTLSFLTVKPEGEESVKLNFTVSNPTPDEAAEYAMFDMVNKERKSRGLPPVEFSSTLQQVAREHSQDMLQRGYFSHITPEGLSPFDRMKAQGIGYGAAGENIALAPSVDLAMTGFMKSPGHKANILSPNFKKLGVGVMDGGVYGEMFSQEFSD